MDYITESYSVDLGLKGLFLEKDLQLKLVFSDIFRTSQGAIISVVNGINYIENFKHYDI